MKLKTFLFLLIVGLFANVTDAYSGIDAAKDISLKGELTSPGSRSVVLPVISAKQYDDVILVDFTKILGTVDVTIISEDGEEVYTTTLDVTTPLQHSIFIGGFESGVYLIEFTNAVRGRVYGEFIIE